MSFKSNTAIAFVASLMPARFVVERAAALNIRTVVVSNRTHEQAYRYVARRVPGLRVSRLPEGGLPSAVSVVWLVAWARLRGQKVVFFHECCWPVFDLALSLFQPAAMLFPRVEMSRMEAIGRAELPRANGLGERVKRMLFRLVEHRFQIYRLPASPVAGDGYNYFFTFKNYPPTTLIFPFDEHRSTAPTPSTDGSDPTSPCVGRIIFVVGTEVVPDERLRSIYGELIEMAQSEGYSVYVKDHPMDRLAISCDTCEHLDPAMPLELTDLRFAFAIGIASTALLGVGDRKISILDALAEMPDDIKRTRRAHLVSLAGVDAVEFVSSLDHVRQLLRTHAAAVRSST